MECKTWCLGFKKDNGINWGNIKLELLEAQSAMNDQEAKRNEHDLRKQIWARTDIKLEFWKQRARTKWDGLGDKPTSFFFKCAKARQARNEIKAIKGPDGKWLSNPNAIKSQFVNYFTNLFAGPISNVNDIDIQDWMMEMQELNPT